MPSTREHVEIQRKAKEKPKLGGGGPGKIPFRRGFGGGDDGDNEHRDPWPSRTSRLRRSRIAMFMCIISVSTVFIGLTGVVLWKHSRGGIYDPARHELISDWRPLNLPYGQLWFNSLVLLVSSATLELARRKLYKKSEFHVLGVEAPREHREVPWLGLTVLLGFLFLCGQVLVWSHFRGEGLYEDSNPNKLFFYVLTASHALHLTGGLIALLCAACWAYMRRKFESRLIVVEVTSWYWHFMGALWMYIFGLLYVVRK